MPYNVLIFPLIGGYYILTNFLYLRYRFQRRTSQERLFSSIVIGVGLLFLAVIFRIVFKSFFPGCYDALSKFLNTLPVIKVPYLWTSIFTFVLAFFGTHSVNLVINRILIPYTSIQDPIDIAVMEEGDELEELFLDSAAIGELIQITLKNNKVYIGFTTFISPPSKTNYFILTPVLSGYRESETKKFVITTNYQKVFEEYYEESDKESKDTSEEEDEKNTIDFPDIDIVIKQDEIITAGFFDPDLYVKFNPTATIQAKKEDSEDIGASKEGE